MKSADQRFTIRHATVYDAPMLAELGRRAFVESHGSSATEEVIDAYVSKSYTEASFENSLMDGQQIFYVLLCDGVPAGYSKIVLNTECPDLPGRPALKLDRLYFVQEFYGLGLGRVLLEYIIAKARKEKQEGIWLYVWTENHRAVRFYQKAGFKIAGEYSFQLTANHANANHCMWLELS